MNANILPHGAALRLAALAESVSKHGRYQPVPHFLEGVIPSPAINEKWRTPKLQLDFVRRFRPQFPKTVIELGANLGYVSLSLAMESPGTHFIAVEATPHHAEFIRTVADLFELDVAVVPEILRPADVMARYPDAVLLDFNVAHHFGVDLKVEGIRTPDDWWSSLSSYWGGNKQMPLHDPADPSGFAQRILETLPRNASTYCLMDDERGLAYQVVDPSNLSKSIESTYQKHDLVGEYFRRPIFVF